MVEIDSVMTAGVLPGFQPVIKPTLVPVIDNLVEKSEELSLILSERSVGAFQNLRVNKLQLFVGIHAINTAMFSE